MKSLGTIAGAAALVAVMGFAGATQAEILYSFDSDLVAYWPFDVDGVDPTLLPTLQP